jgi:hypothetical protein
VGGGGDSSELAAVFLLAITLVVTCGSDDPHGEELFAERAAMRAPRSPPDTPHWAAA